jgi:archaetidylinositol phosphate synthase
MPVNQSAIAVSTHRVTNNPAPNPPFQNATRLQISITAKLERRILLHLAARLPQSINSDHLTLLGFISMFAAGASYALARYSSLGLLGATIALAINWFGDSLDGTLARVRNQQRPRYGFYVDHLIDSFGALLLTAGLAASAYMAWPTGAALLVAFLLLSIESYLATYTLGVFHMSHAGLGPTEIRILLAIANLTLYFHPQSAYIHLAHYRYRLLDFVGIISAVVMFIMLIAASLAHTRTLYQLETKPSATVASIHLKQIYPSRVSYRLDSGYWWPTDTYNPLRLRKSYAAADRVNRTP